MHDLSAKVHQSLKGLERAIDEVRLEMIPAHVSDVMTNMTGMSEKFAAGMDVIESQMRLGYLEPRPGQGRSSRVLKAALVRHRRCRRMGNQSSFILAWAMGS